MRKIMKATIPLHCRLTLLSFVILSTVLLNPARSLASGTYDWPQFDFNEQHSGNNTLETTLTAANVSGLNALFHVPIPQLQATFGGANVVDGAPAYLSNVKISDGTTHDLLFVTSKAANLIALDATTGAKIWAASHPYSTSDPSGTNCTDSSPGPCYTTSSPAVDGASGFVYNYGLDGKVHKHAVGTGTETIDSHWPEVATVKTPVEKGSSALSIASAGGTTYLYVTNGGYPGDNGDYQGHVTAINLSTGAQQIFNMMCSNNFTHMGSPSGCGGTQSAVWARVGTIYDPSLNKMFIATGNGTFAPASFFWGDSILALNPDGTGAGTGKPLDSYTPTNFSALQAGDTDLGSTAPAILPNSAGRHWAVQSGKDANLRLVNLDNLNGTGVVGTTGGQISIIGVPQGGEVLTQPAVWVNPADSTTWVFVANGSGISGLQLQVTAGVPSLHAMWQSSASGSSPIIANNVLYVAGGGDLRALSPTTGSVLWSSASASVNIGGIHWESPIVDNGVLYITDENSDITAYRLGGSQPLADLSVTDSVSSTYTGGLPLTFTITLHNSGPSAATNVTLNDVWTPSQFNPASLSWTCSGSCPASAGTFTTGNDTTVPFSMPNGATATFTLTGTVGSATTSAINNTVTVASADDTDLTPADNSATASSSLAKADLSLTKTGPYSAMPGSNITYTVSVSNAGPNPAQNASLTDMLPPNTTFVSETQTAGPALTCTKPPPGGTGTITCSTSSFKNGMTATFSIVLKVNAATPNATAITNTASINSPTIDPNTANNSASVTTIVNPQADLAVTASGPAIARPGSVLTYLISLTNHGPDTAQSVQITDNLPAANIGFVSETQTAGPAFACTNPPRNGTGAINCTLATMTSGATATFKIVIVIRPNTAANTVMSNSLNGSSATADPTIANNSATVTTTVS